MRWVYVIATLLVFGTIVADIWVDFIDYRLGARISLIYVSVFVTVFTLLYMFRSNWRANEVGRVFLIKGVAFSVFLTEITVANWWNLEYPGRYHVRFAIGTLAAITYLAMVVTLWRNQQRDRRDASRS